MNIRSSVHAQHGRILSVVVLLSLAMPGLGMDPKDVSPPPFGPVVLEPLRSDLSPALR